jgi:major membrane immunogen (membrane-anchored lipoprotein)
MQPAGVCVGAHEYVSSVNDRKARLTITVDSHLIAYADHLVETGHATSVSAAFNEAMAEKAYRDRRRRSLWKAKREQADPARVARMVAHVDQQLSQ